MGIFKHQDYLSAILLLFGSVMNLNDNVKNVLCELKSMSKLRLHWDMENASQWSNSVCQIDLWLFIFHNCVWNCCQIISGNMIIGRQIVMYSLVYLAHSSCSYGHLLFISTNKKQYKESKFVVEYYLIV